MGGYDGPARRPRRRGAGTQGAPGGDIVTTCSITLVHALEQTGLVDEYRLFVYPAVLCRGRASARSRSTSAAWSSSRRTRSAPGRPVAIPHSLGTGPDASNCWMTRSCCSTVIDAGCTGLRQPPPTSPRNAAWKVPRGTRINDQSASLTVGLEGPLVGRNECPVAFAADGETDDVSVAVIVLDEGPDDDGVRAFRGLHLRTVQGGCDLKDLHSHHGKPGDP